MTCRPLFLLSLLMALLPVAAAKATPLSAARPGVAATAKMLAPAQVEPIADCISQMSGLPRPAVLPEVWRDRRWSLTLNEMAQGWTCCTEAGEQALNSASRSINVLAFYDRRPRLIWLGAGARDEALVHELAADMWLAARKLKNPTRDELRRMEAFAYRIDREWPFAPCRVKLEGDGA